MTSRRNFLSNCCCCCCGGVIVSGVLSHSPETGKGFRFRRHREGQGFLQIPGREAGFCVLRLTSTGNDAFEWVGEIVSVSSGERSRFIVRIHYGGRTNKTSTPLNQGILLCETPPRMGQKLNDGYRIYCWVLLFSFHQFEFEC